MNTHQTRQFMSERMLATTGLEYAACLFVMLFYAGVGHLTLKEALYYGFASLVALVSFYILTHTKFRLKLHDPNLQLLQAWIALVLQGIFAVRIPAFLNLFACVCLIMMVFAALQFNVRRYLTLWTHLVIGSFLVTFLLLRQQSQFINVIAYWSYWLYFILIAGALAFVSARITYLRDIVRERNRNMSATLNRYRHLLSHDDLTHALSRRFFMEILSQTVAQAKRYETGFCVAMMDLDHFKRVNDQYGHPIGDAVLRAVCEAAWASLRQVDQIGRYGGEEFAVLLPQCQIEDAIVVLNRVREAVASTHLEHLAPGLKMTISIGLTAYRPKDNVNDLLERADQALYQAKQTGRNQVKNL